MSGFIRDARMMGEAFAEWVKEKHPEFIEKNKKSLNPVIYAHMFKLYYEYIKEIGEETKKDE